MHAEGIEAQANAGSFRDPAGFVFERGGRLLRQVNRAYAADYTALMQSGLYARLSGDAMLVRHAEVEEAPLDAASAERVIAPERIGFVSYPYEWSFSALRDAALLTLALQKRALEHGMALKDASAYNIQFVGTRPVHIDTLSFERYREGEPWVAYRQFCEHFLAPLALCGRIDPRLGRLLASHLDGIPLDLASPMLPVRTWMSPGLLMHVHLHARFQRRFGTGSGEAAAPRAPRVSRNGMLGLVDSLERAVSAIEPPRGATAWTHYDASEVDAAYRQRKLEAVTGALAGRRVRLACDLGANQGAFSRAIAGSASLVVSADGDPAVVDANYRACRAQGIDGVLPLVVELSNPAGGLGWGNTERPPFLERARPDVALALALVHHLVIANNVPLRRVASLLRGLSPELLIEFVPAEDPQTRRLIAARRDAVHEYSRAAFEQAFGAAFGEARRQPLSQTGRSLYHYGAPA